MNLTNKQAERFWKKVTIPANVVTDCWLWTGSHSKLGYGYFRINRQPAGPTLAHRISWEEVNGPIPVGLLFR